MMVAVGLIPRFEVWRTFPSQSESKSESIFVSVYLQASLRDANTCEHQIREMNPTATFRTSLRDSI